MLHLANWSSARIRLSLIRVIAVGVSRIAPRKSTTRRGGAAHVPGIRNEQPSISADHDPGIGRSPEHAELHQSADTHAQLAKAQMCREPLLEFAGVFRDNE